MPPCFLKNKHLHPAVEQDINFQGSFPITQLSVTNLQGRGNKASLHRCQKFLRQEEKSEIF